MKGVPLTESTVGVDINICSLAYDYLIVVEILKRGKVCSLSTSYAVIRPKLLDFTFYLYVDEWLFSMS